VNTRLPEISNVRHRRVGELEHFLNLACGTIPVTSFHSYKVRHSHSHLVSGRPHEPVHELGRPESFWSAFTTRQSACVSRPRAARDTCDL